MHKLMIASGAFFSLLSVGLGAFAAHGLKSRLDGSTIQTFQTAVQYQMYHGFALIFCGMLLYQAQIAQLSNQSIQLDSIESTLRFAAGCFVFGILFFSGSLYGLVLTSQKWFGPITPLGGLLFIIGWGLFIRAALKI